MVIVFDRTAAEERLIEVEAQLAFVDQKTSVISHGQKATFEANAESILAYNRKEAREHRSQILAYHENQKRTVLGPAKLPDDAARVAWYTFVEISQGEAVRHQHAAIEDGSIEKAFANVDAFATVTSQIGQAVMKAVAAREDEYIQTCKTAGLTEEQAKAAWVLCYQTSGHSPSKPS